MDLFDYDSYKKYVNDRIAQMPKRGYGQFKKLAGYMSVSTTFVSQVFGGTNEARHTGGRASGGEKSLNLEQGSVVAEFFGLTEIETEYFLKLILLERAGTEKLRKILRAEVAKLKAHAQKISSRLQIHKVLTDEDKAIFYSDWHYSAIRLLSAIESYQDVDSIAARLDLPRKTVSEAIHFLLHSGLLKQNNGRLEPGPARTHLDADSPFIKLHHLNWRYKALEFMKSADPEKLHYSSPMTIAKADVPHIRARLVKLIEEVGKIIDESPKDEELMCLNVDWFRPAPQRG